MLKHNTPEKERCQACRRELPAPGAECPYCGNSNLPLTAPPTPDPDTQPSRASRRWWLYSILITLIVLGIAVAAGAFGIYAGLRDRAATRDQTVAQHYQRGMDYLEAEDFPMALAEFEYVANLLPGYSDVEARIAEAREGSQAIATPTSQARGEVAADLMAKAQDEIEGKLWSEAITTLEELGQLDPDHKPEQVRAMRSQSMYSAGAEALAADDVASALSWFTQALEANPESVDARRQVTLASLYLQAMAGWGRDWEATVDRLDQLYSLSPAYADTAIRLATARIRLGDQLSSEGEWCDAASQYEMSGELEPLASVDTKLELASQNCEATPQPEEDSGMADGYLPRGIMGGTIYFADTDPESGTLSVRAVSLAQGLPVRTVVHSAEQPSVRPDGVIAYHDLDSTRLGVSASGADGSYLARVSGYAEDQFPTWNPNGMALAFASLRESDRKWRIYVDDTWATGGEATMIVYGQSPAWGPSGQIAYKGCDTTGNNCGLYLSPPDGSSATALTTNASDDHPAWSPSGRQVAFTSPRLGTSSIWLVQVSTGQLFRLTDDQGLDMAPAFSPDGQFVAFLSNRGGVWGIWVTPVADPSPVQVATLATPPADWSVYQISWR